MIDPTKISVEEQSKCIDINSNHVIKSLAFAMKKLEEYYHGGGEMNGMSYNSMLNMYNKINDIFEQFSSINDRIKNNVTTKLENSKKVSIPRRKNK